MFLSILLWRVIGVIFQTLKSFTVGWRMIAGANRFQSSCVPHQRKQNFHFEKLQHLNNSKRTTTRKQTTRNSINKWKKRWESECCLNLAEGFGALVDFLSQTLVKNQLPKLMCCHRDTLGRYRYRLRGRKPVLRDDALLSPETYGISRNWTYICSCRFCSGERWVSFAKHWKMSLLGGAWLLEPSSSGRHAFPHQRSQNFHFKVFLRQLNSSKRTAARK